MKKHCITIICLIATLTGNMIAQTGNDPVLMTIGGNTKVTKSEFENVYHKNNKNKEAANDGKSLKEYVDLFINFKLKVKEAEEMGLDTSKSFKDELAGYRKQLAQPYLTDKEVNDKLLKEVYERLKLEVKASHILIKCNDNALPKDTLEAYNKAIKYRNMALGKGSKMPFDSIAYKYSDDPSAKENFGDLGYFTAMQMIYPFETAAYNLKPGEISMPVRTRFGYHIIKSIDKRQSLGEVLVAHIMIKTSKGMNAEDSLKTKAKADEIYAKAKAGENFAELAKQFSDDKPSAAKGGELPWFGTNRMPPDFEKLAFSIKNNGDITEPFKTRFGWHIVKRLDKRDIANFEDMKADLKAKVSRDSRSQAGRTSLIAKIEKENNFKENLKMRDEFYKVIDSTYFKATWNASKAASLTKTMFSIKDKNYSQQEFAKFLESHQTIRPVTVTGEVVNQQYKNFVEESCIAYEESILDQKYPEFKALMQEYRDGILLFELTDKKVWSKAIKDTVGLKAYYEKNKNNYMWEERADASIYTCNNIATANKVKELLKKNKSESYILTEVNKDSQLNLQIENKLFNKKENELVDANWKAGAMADKKPENEKVQFVVVRKIVPPTVKGFNEAKGLITADYQAQLEKEWIETLRNKYTVSVDQNVLSTIK